MKKLLIQARITEVGDVATRLVALYDEATELKEESFLKSQFEILRMQATAITEAVKCDTVVSKLKDADARRDEALRVIDKLLKGYKLIPVATLQAHGKKLWAVFQKYGIKITQENYSSQSNLIHSLLSDFSEQSLLASIEELPGMSEAVSNLRSEQLNFDTIRSEYDKALSKWGSNATASSYKQLIWEIINHKIAPYLVAMTLANPALFESFSGEASQIVESVNEAIRVRNKKSVTKTQSGRE